MISVPHKIFTLMSISSCKAFTRWCIYYFFLTQTDTCSNHNTPAPFTKKPAGYPACQTSLFTLFHIRFAHFQILYPPADLLARLIKNILIGHIQFLPDAPQLRQFDMLSSSFNFYKCLPCYVNMTQLKTATISVCRICKDFRIHRILFPIVLLLSSSTILSVFIMHLTLLIHLLPNRNQIGSLFNSMHVFYQFGTCFSPLFIPV